MDPDLSKAERYAILAIVTGVFIGGGAVCIHIANDFFGVTMNIGTMLFTLGYGITGISIKHAIDIFREISDER